MLIDGEKWACDACVRGHRVSNCQHHDRHLQHINKKGRPVSQCQHCRGLRKSRSAHVKCDCGDKGQAHGNCNQKDKAAQHGLCHCQRGGTCACALKKEPQHLGLVPELDLTTGKPSLSKPRLTSANSDNPLTISTSAHHKFLHQKHKHLTHNSNVPFKIARPRTIHGLHQAQRSVDSLPATNSFGGEDSTYLPGDSFGAQHDVRLVRSEHGSPFPSSPASVDFMDDDIPPPLDLSYGSVGPSGVPTMSSRPHLDMSGVTSAPYDPYFPGTPEPADMAYSASCTEAPHVDWPSFNLPMDNTSNVSSPYSQPPSYASFEYGLSNTFHPNGSSDDVSELGDFNAPFGQPSPVRPPSLVNNAVASDSSEMWDADSYRTTSSQHGMPQMSMLSANNMEPVDIDDFIKGAATGQASFVSNSTPAMNNGNAPGNDLLQDAMDVVHSPARSNFGVDFPQHKMAPTSVPTSNPDLRFSVPERPSSTMSGSMSGSGSPRPDSVWMQGFGTPPPDLRRNFAQDMAWTS